MRFTLSGVLTFVVLSLSLPVSAAQITVHTKEYNEDGEDIIKSGKLYLVDCEWQWKQERVHAKRRGAAGLSLAPMAHHDLGRFLVFFLLPSQWPVRSASARAEQCKCAQKRQARSIRVF
jgi:hypothetical protein